MFRCFRFNRNKTRAYEAESEEAPRLLGHTSRDSTSSSMGHVESTFGGKSYGRQFSMTSNDTNEGRTGRKSVREVRKARKSVVFQADCMGDLDDEDLRAEILLKQAQEEQEMDAMAMEEVVEDADARPLIAMVAHDNMKPLMATFANSYKELLKDFRLTGTGTTCAMLRQIGLEPEEMLVPSGPLGGDQVLGHYITEGEIRAMFFFRDPLSAHAHIADIEALSRLADVYQIYFASNYRTAAATLETLHDNMTAMKNNATRMGAVASVRVPEGMSTNLGEHVMEEYKKTRANVIANAAGAVK